MATLKGSPIPIPKPIYFPVSKDLGTQTFHNIQTYYPGIGILCQLKGPPKNDIWFDHSFRVIHCSGGSEKSSGAVNLRIERNINEGGVDIQDISGFRKITHLLDPVHWIQGKYSLPKHISLPWHQESWGAAWQKLQDPMNQAYVEALITYAFGKLREGDFTPHYHRFFGAFCAIADNYAYNITDSFMSYRHCRWFWRGQDDKIFKVGFEEDVPNDVRDAIVKKPDEIYDSDHDEKKSVKSAKEANEEVLDDLHVTAEIGSIHSADMEAIESASDESEDDDEDDDDDSEDLNIFAEVQKFPVMVIYTESSKGTMDDLLDDFVTVGSKPGTKEWDTTWAAWIFQVIAALTVGQTLFGFTHNDLHSNNIVWTNTNDTHIYYKTRDGITFKVPTFGKLFRLIDFGRSIYTINDRLFFSDDFRPGNDAAEQFNFGEIYISSEPEVKPNPSFDLSRFTVSIFESIFPSSPKARPNGAVLSNESGLKVIETESDLYNMLWSWLLCDDGHNVLMESDGRERYPDFELYKIISAQVHNAVPSEQIRKPVFEQFRVDSIPDGQKVYSLFC